MLLAGVHPIHGIARLNEQKGKHTHDRPLVRRQVHIHSGVPPNRPVNFWLPPKHTSAKRRPVTSRVVRVPIKKKSPPAPTVIATTRLFTTSAARSACFLVM